jgi:hypothetical protein
MAGVEDLVNSLQKKFGKEVVAGNNTQGVEFVSSGSLSLDLALGGGYAMGRIIELRGYESSGKTTLALTACKNYGGRGITMDPRWEDFENFYADMGDPPSELHTLDRRENDLGYTKANCRWATQEEQSKNKRTSVYLELNGVRKTIGDWASSLGIHSSALRPTRRSRFAT